MKLTIVAILVLFLNAIPALSQQLTVQSPNQKILVSLFADKASTTGEWYLDAVYEDNDKDLYCGYMDCAYAGEKVIN
jgi:hypothetical protein